MDDKASPILCCVPFLKPHEKHMEHFFEWYIYNHSRFPLRRYREFYRSLQQVQSRAVQLARLMGASHILFTEDDQWGYPVEGLEALLEADKEVIGFKTYFKKYPYLSMAMRRKDPEVPLDLITRTQHLVQIEGVGPGTDPIQKVDLLSWAFTLVRMTVFDRMEEAGLEPFRQWGPVPTDSFFCQYCEDIGVEKFVDFRYTIGHGDIPPGQLHHYRRLHEAIHMDKKMMQRRLITLEDDYGLPYGQAEYEPGPAKIMRQLQETEGNGKKLPEKKFAI